jgi:hypothetical protein
MFQSGGAFEVHRATLPRDAVRARDNRLVISAGGVPGATARVAIIATRVNTRRRADTGEQIQSTGDRNATASAAPAGQKVFLARAGRHV